MFSIALVMLAQAVPAYPAAATNQETGEVAEAAIDAAVSEAPSPDVEAPQQPAPPEPTAEIVVPKGHPILITIEGQVGSKISQARDFFPIRLAQAVEIDGVEVLPAGLTGEGQVVHAEKAGFAGSAGELILAARYLTFGDRQIALRSFKFIEEGEEISYRGTDNSQVVLATVAVLGPLGFLIGGGNTTIEPGTIAHAKIRDDEVFPIAAGQGSASENSD